VRSFAYARPYTLQEALTLLADQGARAGILAGGTDLLVRLRAGRQIPDVVVDLKRVAELRSDVSEVDGMLRIGARTVLTDVIEDARVLRSFPALVEAASVVGSIQIRNRATLTGNICNASPAADTAPALLVYEAIVNLVGTGGERKVPIAEFVLGPGRTALQCGEIVHSIDLPVPDERDGSAFGRITRRFGVDLATINVCCRVRSSGETCFAFGAAAPRPFLARDRTGMLAQPTLDPDTRDAILCDLISDAAPISDIRASQEYRKAMLLVASRRAWQTALERLHGTGALP